MGLTYAVRALIGTVIIAAGWFIFWFTIQLGGIGARTVIPVLLGFGVMIVGGVLVRPPVTNAWLRQAVLGFGCALLVLGVIGCVVMFDATPRPVDPSKPGSEEKNWFYTNSVNWNWSFSFIVLGLILAALNRSAMGELTSGVPAMQRSMLIIGIGLVAVAVIGLLAVEVFHPGAKGKAVVDDTPDEFTPEERSAHRRSMGAIALRILGIMGAVIVVLNHGAMGELLGKAPAAPEEEETEGKETPAEEEPKEEPPEKEEEPEEEEEEPEVAPAEHAPPPAVKEIPPKVEKAPVPRPTVDTGGPSPGPKLALVVVGVIAALIYLVGMGPSYQGPHARIDSWGPAEHTLDAPATIAVTVTNDGSRKGSFVILGHFVQNRGLHLSPGTAGWKLEEGTLSVTLEPGASKVVKAYTLTPHKVHTGELGFRVRVYRADASGKRIDPEDDRMYQDLVVKG